MLVNIDPNKDGDITTITIKIDDDELDKWNYVCSSSETKSIQRLIKSAINKYVDELLAIDGLSFEGSRYGGGI